MLHLKAEAEQARRLAATAHDMRLARELTAYAVEIERVIARNRLNEVQQSRRPLRVEV